MERAASERESIVGAARTVRALADSIECLASLGPVADDERWEARGYIEPQDDVRLWVVWSSYLRARQVLRQAIDDLAPIGTDTSPRRDPRERLEAFAVAYAAACQLIRGGRALVRDVARTAVVRRKLDEARPEFGIPSRQYARLYRALVSPRTMWRLYWARAWADENRAALDDLGRDPELTEVMGILVRSEEAIRLSVPEYARHRLRYHARNVRRRALSAVEEASFALFEGGGRLVSKLRWPWTRKRVNPIVIRRLAAFLEPGDVLVTRHRDAASNLFLPGYWPHAALHVGDAQVRERLGVLVDDARRSRWAGEVRILEALADGARFRTLERTLAVDEVAVLRPQIPADHIARALERAIAHEGKLYDFSFDFSRADRVVCSELVYRGYHGLAGIDLPLVTRAGRPTLSPEDLVRAACRGEAFAPVAVFGAPGARRKLLTGARAAEVIRATLALTRARRAPA